mgnify:CR=1 FL=1
MNYKLSILFVTSGDIEKNATIKRAVGISKHLSTMNFKVHILALDSIGNKERFDYEELDHVCIHYFKSFNSLKELFYKVSFLRNNKFDIVYVTSPSLRNSIIYFKLFLNKSKYLVEYSELASSIKSHKFYRRCFLYFLEFSSSIFYDGFIAASKYLYDHYKKKISSDLILYLPYAYPHNFIERIKNNQPIKNDNLNIFYMGTIIENYGFKDIIKLASFIKASNLKIKISVLGGGKNLNDAKSLIKKNNLKDVIEMFGYVPEKNVFTHCNNADIFICPLNDTIQDWARCPSKIYYYLPFKKPIITSKVGEPIQIFGENGIYYKIGDIESLYNQIIELSKSDYENFPNPLLHSWLHRTNEFVEWIDLKFKIYEN